MTAKLRLPRWASPSQLIPLGGIAAAVFIAVVVNVLAARHFRRWDWTRGKLYTLSPATLDTLHDLPDTIEIWVLLGSSDPLFLSVKQLLVSYSAESPRLDIHYVDPDRDALQLLDVRRRFKIEAERAQDGRVVTDASIVVARGDRHWFIGSGDLVEITEADDTRAKPKEEQALTGAIRNVLVGDKARLCFTTGHGEMSVNDPGPRGLGLLGGLLEKDNYQVVEIDPKDPGTAEPFKGCAVAVVAAPQAAFTPEEETRLRTYLMTGGNLLAALQPIAAVSDTGLVAPGLAGALAPFGIAVDEDVVIEQDPNDIVPGQIAAFTVTAKPHAVTVSLVKDDKKRAHDPPRVLVLAPRSMRPTKDGAAPVEVLSTSAKAFGVTNVTGASTWPVPEGPEKTARDLPGPLAIAMASERPKLTTKSPHGPRAFVIGTGSVLQPINWTAPAADRGAAFLVENAISWLAARPVVLDIPEKPAGVSSIHVSEDSRAGVWRYVLLYVPGAAALLGLAVALRRRSTEGREWKGEPPPPKGRPGERGPVVKLRQHVTELILFVLAGGALIAFLLERGKATDTERRDRDHDVFPAYRRSDVELIELTQGGATVRLERRPGAIDGGDVSWHMTSPIDEAADPAAVDRLVGDLEFAGVIRRVDPSLARGFDSPRVVGTLSMKRLIYHFVLGGAASTPDGAGYLRVDGEGTFVVSRDFVKVLTSPVDTYRNRTVVPYLSLDLAHLELDSPGGHFTLDRADEVSFRFSDTGVRASRTTLDRVWGALAEVRAESFLSDTEADRALGPTPIRVVMTPKDPKKPSAELLIGGPCPDHPESAVFVRRSPTRASACVPGGARPGLMTRREDLVDRHLFASRADEIEEVILETIPPDTTIELARKGRGWHERKPTDREVAGAEASAANELVTKLTQGEGTRVTVPPGSPLLAARARARLFRGNSKVEEVVELLARPATIRRAFDGAVLEVSPSLAHRLWPSEIALRGASVFPAGFAGQVPVSVRVHCDGISELATREGHDAKASWLLAEPRGYLADPLAISDLAALVQNAQASSWIADRDDGELGFGEGSCQVDVTLAGEAGNAEVGLVFGKETEDGDFYAHATKDSAVFLAPRLLREGLDTLLIDRGGFRADPALVSQVSLSNGKANRTLRSGPGRALDAGGRDPTSRVLAALETLRPDTVVHLGPPKPGEGFRVPSLDVRVQMRLDGGTREIHFVVGDTALVDKHRLTFARVDGVDATFGIAHDRLEPLFDAL